ncbi:MAG: hypothetical protein Q8R60_11830 [Mycobacteriales bacterium]|nr:hypothetical protein [Mycobacteriales bacterium]
MKRWFALPLLAGTALVVALPAHAAVTKVYVGSFYFSTTSGGPSNTAIAVDNGDQLTFIGQDNGHTVEVPGLGISESLAKGETFTTGALMKAGSYSLYCSPHEQRGHKTTLTVRAATAPEPEPTQTSGSTSGTTSGGSTSGSTSGGSTSGSTSGGSTTGGSTTGGSTTSGSTTGGSTTSGSTTGGSTTGGSTTGGTTTGSTTGGTSTSGTTGPAAGVTASSPTSPVTSPTATPDGGSTGDGSAVAAGRGTADAGDVDLPAAEGSLEDLLGRPAAQDGSWTRSVRLALLVLLPMLALAAWSLAGGRRRRATSAPQ